MTQKKRRRKTVKKEVKKDVPIEVKSEDDAVVEAVEADALVAAAERADAAEERVNELEEKLKRVQAEFLNESKRIARQAAEGRKYAVDSLVEELIPVFDALHSARAGLVSEEGVRTGLDLLEKELLKVLGRHGVERIEASGLLFDPGLHEAVFVVDDPDLEPSSVAQVLRPGFTLHGRVVRPAHVSVTRAAEAGNGDAEDDSDVVDDEGVDTED